MLRGKLGSIRRQVDRRSGFLKVINNGENAQNSVKNWRIAKEKHGVDVKREMYTSNVRKAFVRWRMLQKCLVNDRQGSAESNLYGQYGGRPINTYGQQIDYYIEDSSPAKQKKRKIKHQMKDGRKKGKILDTDAVLDKITDYFQDQWGVRYKPTLNNNKEEHFEDRFKPRRMELKAPDKLPPIPTLKKSLTTPISLSKRQTKDKLPYRSLEEDQSDRKQKMERLLRKVECTRPSCDGYLGNTRTISVRKVLPPIQRIARSNSDSTLG